MYKMVEIETHDIWLGQEQAVIEMANDRLWNKEEDFLIEYCEDLKNIGVVVKIGDNGCYTEKIKDIDTAIKFLELDDVEVVDIGDILEDLKNNFCVLISQEE